MRKLVLGIGAALLLWVGFAPSAHAQLQPFVSPDSHFSILMPGTVKTESEPVKLNNSDISVTMYEFYVELENQNVSYMLMYNDYPPNVGNDPAQTMLERFRDGAVAGKTLLTDQAISLNGVPGRAFTSVDKDGWDYDVRQYYQGHRLYQLIIVTNKGYSAAYRDQFMNSFAIK
jgi:hypothetical protein